MVPNWRGFPFDKELGRILKKICVSPVPSLHTSSFIVLEKVLKIRLQNPAEYNLYRSYPIDLVRIFMDWSPVSDFELILKHLYV